VIRRRIVVSQTIPTEDQEQIALMKWANHYPLLRKHLRHIPMGGKRPKKLIETKNGPIWICPAGNKLKRMGASAGIVDFILSLPSDGYLGYWAELKRRDSVLDKVGWSVIKTLPIRKTHLTQDQHDWLTDQESVGFKVDVWYGADHAIKCITEYTNLHLGR
jgi:hypothetical protein